jgi:hypothetical protein
MQESGAYSEDFEEESLQKSSNAIADALQKEQKIKMDTVKEESIDESIIDHSKTQSQFSDEQSQSQGYSNSHSQSKNTPKQQAPSEVEQDSLPTEDYEIDGSCPSVEWQLHINQSTHRSEGARSEIIETEKSNSIVEEEEVETSSDLNTRDEMADL